MSLSRQIRRLRKAKEVPAARKRRKALLEPLEPRLLLDADLSFGMTEDADDLTLKLGKVGDVDELQIINTNTSVVLDSLALSGSTEVEIIGSDEDDVLRLDLDFDSLLDSLSIVFQGGTGFDTLDFSSIEVNLAFVATQSGGVTVTDGEYTANEDGTVSLAGGTSTITGSGVENVIGGKGDNTYVFENGAALVGTIDGGTGGNNSLDYSAYSISNPVVVDLSAGIATGTGGVSHIQNVIGGLGDDTLTGTDSDNVLSGGPGNDTLSGLGGEDLLGGDEGEDTLIGPEGDTLWEITGANEGSLNKEAEFSGIENLVGSANNQDGFVFFTEGSISGSITGGGGGSDGLIVEDPAEEGPFTVINPDNSGAGTVSLYGKTIIYGGMEPIVDTSIADTVVIHGSVYDDVFVLEGAAEVGNMQIRSLSGDFFDAENADFISALVFANPADTFMFRLDAGEDSLTISSFDPAFSAEILYEGGAGFDTLTGPDGPNTWNISGENAGWLNGFISFSGAENLLGGSGQDEFIFAEGAGVDGLIDGGGGGNTLNYAALTSGITVALGMDIDNIDVVIGGSGEDTLFGLPDQTTWHITGMGGGRVVTTGAEGTVVADVLFSGFENLEGRLGDDTFLFDDGMGVTGFIDGGGGSNTLDYSAYTAANSVAVNLGSGGATGASSVGNIHNVIGGAGNDTLLGPDGDSLWHITGADSGDVAGILFTGFENLVGAPDNEDGFIFYIDGSVSGTVDGGAGGFDGVAVEDPSHPGSLTPLEPNPAGAGTGTHYGKTITYAGMEPIYFIDTADPNTATIRTFFLPEQVTLAQGITETQLRLEVQIGTFQFIQLFNIPSQSLTIDLGGGGDTLTISQIDMPGCGLTLLGGGGDDSVVFSGDVISRGGNLSVAAETVTVNSGVVLSTRNAQGNQETDPSEGDSGELSLAGKTIIIGSGAKLLTFDSRLSEADPRGIPSAIDNQAWSGEEKLWRPGKRYTNLETTSSGSGTGLTVDVTTDDDGLPKVRLNTRGAGYAIGDTITITDTEDKIGGPVTVEISGLMGKGGDIIIAATDHKLAIDNSTADAGIEINGATLWGRDVIIKADADNDVIFDGEKNTAEKIGESVLDALLNLRPLVGVSRVGSVAGILINTGTLIRADGDVTLDAHANSEANIITLGVGASVAYARSEADAAVTVASGAEISAVGSVSLGSAADNVVSVSAKNFMSKTPEKLGEKLGGVAIPTHITVTVTEAYSHATTTVADGATITAGEDVDVFAYNTKNLKSIASSGGNADYFGAAVVVALSEATAEAAIHGTVTATNGDVSVIARTDSIKNITNAQSIHGDSKFAKTTSYLSEITPFKILKDTGMPLGKAAMSGVSSLIDAVKLKVKGRPRSDAVVERPQEDKTTEKIRKFGGSAAVAVGVHENSATATIGGTAVVKAGGNVTVRADAVDRPDITAVSIVSSGTDKQKKEKERDKWEETEVSQPEYAASIAVLVGDYTNTSHAAIDSGAVVDAGGSILIRSKTEVPYYPIWEQVKNLYVDSEAGIRDIVASVMFADIGLNSFVTSWALSAAEGKKAGIAGSVNLFMADNTSTALIGEGALINQNGNVPGDVTVKATTEFEAVNLAGHYPGFLEKVQIDKKEGLKDEKAGGQASEGDTAGIGGSYAGLYLNNTTRAAIESGAKVTADNLAVDAQTITKNITLGLSGGEAATYAVGGVVTLVDIADSTLAKIDDGATLEAKGNIDVTALDDALNVNFTGGVMQGRSIGFGITAGINLIDRDTRAIIGNQEAALGRGEFAPNTGVNGVENSIDLGYAHGFNTGDRVTYSNGGGGSIGGLIDGEAYYVKVVSDRTVKLARSIEDASEEPVTFFSVDAVDDNEDANTIDLGYSHGYQTGDAVVYRNGGEESIGGLNDGQTYFIIRVSDTEVRLAELLDDALSETPLSVDLDPALGGSVKAHSLRLDLEPSIGTGSSHSLGIGFDPTTAVNSSEGTIDLGYEHGFITGQRVVYSNGGGQSIDGLENKGIYYAVVVDPFTVRLAESPWKAHEGIFIALDGSTTEGISHTIGGGFTPIPFVDGNADTIRFEGAHGFAEGQAIVYDSGDGAPIGGLTSGETYYVNRIDAHTIKLAGTAGGEALPLDPAVASGTGHRLLEADDVDGSVSSEGKTTLSAKNDGLIVTATVAASKTGDKASSKEEKGGKEAPSGGGKYGTAISGSVSVNSVSDVTKAYIADSVITGADDLEVKALETTQVISVSGAGALSTNQKGTFGLAGAVTVNVIDNDTSAYIHNSIFQNIGTLTLHSRATGRIVGVAAGLSGATRGTGIAGSVSVNVIDSDTGAYVDAGSDISGATGVFITATDTASIDAVAGVIAYGGKAGVGAGVAVNTIDTSIKASVADSDINTSGTLALSAQSDSNILAIAAAIGASKGTMAAAISVSVNLISNDTQASLLGTRTDDGISAGGGVSLTATDTSDIKVYAGGIALAFGKSGGDDEKKEGKSKAFTFGIAIAVNDIDNDVYALIDGSTVTSGGDVALLATSRPTIYALTIGGSVSAAVGKKGGLAFAGAGAGSGNSIRNITEAAIKNGSTVETTGAGAVTLTATDTSKITADAGGVAIAIGAGGQESGAAISIGVSIADNLIANQTRAYIDGSTVTAAGNLELTAVSAAKIDALTIAGAVGVGASAQKGGFAAAGAGAASYNDVGNTVEAYVKRAPSIQSTGGSLKLTAIDGLLLFESSDLQATDYHNDGILPGAWRTAFTAQNITLSNDVTVSVRAEGREWLVKDNDKDDTYLIKKELDSYRVLKPTVITADGGGVAVAVGATAGQKAAGSLSVGVSTADNTIHNAIKAYIDNSGLPHPSATTVRASGDITLSATSMAEIDSLTIGGGIAVGASGGGAGFAGAAGGAAAYNTIQNTIESFMKGVGTITSANGDLTLTATDSAAIIADAVGGSIAVGAGGASTGGALSIGVSIAHNTISNQTLAYIDNSGLPDSEKTIDLNAGNVSILATSMDTIDALSIAASISVGAGTKAGIALSGGGSDSTNVILTKTNAYILNTDLESAGDVLLAATNMSDIDAVVVTASVSAGFGGKAGVAASVGASLAQNLIGWDEDDVQTPAQVQAYVKDSAIDTDGDLTLRAVANETIEAVVVAGSVAISGGGTAGVGLAGSGADAENKISTLVKAFIDGDGATGIVADNITLTALDLSNIRADVGAGSLAASFAGPAAVSLSVGVALAENTIRNQVEAYIANAESVTATDGSITIQALEGATVDALSVAASLAASFSGGVGVALSGAGSETANTIANIVKAYIADSSVTTMPSAFDYTQQDSPTEIVEGDRVRLDGGGIYEYVGTDPLEGDMDLGEQAYTDATLWKPINDDVVVDALSVSTVTALVGAASAAVSGGQVAASGSIGVALLDNLIFNQITAYIEDSTVSSADDILVKAKAMDTIDAVSFSGSVAIAGGPGGALAGCGTEVTNTLMSGVNAYLKDTVATAVDDIDVKALSDSHIVKSQAIGVAVASSLGSASVAASLVDNYIGNTVQAYVIGFEGENIDAGGDVSILADVERARMSDVSATTASVTTGVVGLSGGGIDIQNTIANTVNAYINGPINVTADGDVSIVASEDAYIIGDATAVSISVSLGAGLGVALVENEISSTIEAWVSGATITSANTLIHADSVADVAKTISCGVSGSAILGAQGNEATAHIKTLVKAYAENATLNSTHDVAIQATSSSIAKTNAKGGAFGAIAVGAMVSDINLGAGHEVYEVEAAVGSGTTVNARTLRIMASSSDDLLAESTAGGGGAVAAAGAESDVASDQATLARIGAGAQVEVSGLVVTSLHTQDVDTSADSYAFAAAAGSGAGVSSTITTKANVDIGAGATVNAGNILINAKNELTKDDYKDSSNLRSGSASLGNVTVLLSETAIGEVSHPFEAVVTIGNDAKLTVAGDNQNPGVFKIEALNKIAAFDSVRIESVSGFGVSTGISRVESDTLAAINLNGAVLESKAGDVYLTAKTNSTVSSSANLFVATALTGGAGAKATTTTKATNQINMNGGAIKGSDVYLYAGRDSSEVPNLINAFANVELTAISMLPNIAVPIPTVDIQESNTVSILGTSPKIQALEDVNLLADQGMAFRQTDGLALSLSLIPYGFPIPGYGAVASTNLVTIGEGASIEAGINNQAILLIKPVTLLDAQTIDLARLEGTSAERLLTNADKLKEAISYVFVSDQDVVEVVAGANKGGVTGNRYAYKGDPDELVLSEEDYSDGTKWTDVTSSTTEDDVTYSSDYVTDVEYEYFALNAREIAFTVYTGTVIHVVDDDPDNPFAGNGEIDAFYRYRIESDEPARIVLNEEDFTNQTRWEKLVVAHDLNTLPEDASVAIQKGQIVRTTEDELYAYLGANATGVNLQDADYGDVEKWGQIGPDIYKSDVTLASQEALENKFYAVKPTRIEAPTLTLQNVGQLLLAQREQILDWMANHSSNPEAVARYEIELALLEEALVGLGLMEIYEDTATGEKILVANEGLNVLFVELPNIYAAPGSIFINADAAYRSGFVPLVDNQLIAKAGAKISVFNETPLSMTVSDMVIRDTKKVTVVDGDYTVLSPGNVYFNNKGLTTIQDAPIKKITIIQDAVSQNSEDYGLEEGILPENIGQDMYILGDVINEVGDVAVINNEGSINVSGEIRAENVDIDAAQDFNLNTEDWFHVMDPRQYPGLDAYRKLVFNQAGTLKQVTYPDDVNPFESVIDPWDGAVLSQGRVAVTARYLNINGVIQSGVQTITLHVDESFKPSGATSFLDDDGDPIAGISFGTDRVPVDGYFDAQKQAIVVDEIVPKGGRIDLAGQILSTGSGMLRVAYGYTSVDIQNDSPYALVLNRIDTTTKRDGLITITDTARLQKVIYEVDGDEIKETLYQGTFTEGDPAGTASRIEYDQVGIPQYHDLSDPIEYEPREGLQYVWTEGQEKTTVIVTYYKKRSFNLFGFDWDSLAKDENYEWRTINYRDAYPLLESEILAVDPNYTEGPDTTVVTLEMGQTVKTYDEVDKVDKVYMYQGPTAEIDLSTADYTDAAKWVEVVETPSYADDKSYTVQFELRKDTDVDLFKDVSIIKVVNDANGVLMAKGGVVGHRYLYIGDNAELVLRDQDYSVTAKWTDVTTSTTDKQVAYNSDFLNYSFQVQTWQTGGGWLRYKTIHMLTTQIFGQKDYYTHTLRADYPVDVQFLEGSETPSISIQTKQDLYLQGTITSPGEGTVSLVSTAGSVIFGDEAAVLGVSPEIQAAKSVRANVEGGKAPDTGPALMPMRAPSDSQGRSITSNGNIEIRVVFDSEGNQSSTLVVGQVISTGGNVILHAGEGIQPFDASSLVKGNRIELYTRVGAIGSEAMPLQVDSDALGSGGVAARARGDIFIVEVEGDLKLSQPQSWEEVQASIHSETGDVILEAAEGAILDAFYEEFRPRTEEEAEALDQELQLTGQKAQAAAEASIRAEENTQTQLYHAYWETYRDAKPGDIEHEMTVETIHAGENTITFSEAHGLEPGDQVFFSVGVDLGDEDFDDTSQWVEIVPDAGMVPDYDLKTLTPGARVMLQTDQMIRTTDGTFYRYQGESATMPYANLDKGVAYYAVVMDGTTIQLALSRYDAAISEIPVVLDIKIEGSDEVVLQENEADFGHVNFLEFGYTYGDLAEGTTLEERYQDIHDTYGDGAYDPNFIYQLSDQERQERIADRTFSSNALRYQISQSLFSFLYPDAEGGGAGAPAETPNVIANHLALKAGGQSGQIGRVTGVVTIDLSGGFENLPIEHQEILTYAGVDDVVSVTYDPDDPNQIQTLTLQVWNDVDVEAPDGVNITAGAGVALETEGDLVVNSVAAGGDVRLVAGGAVIDPNAQGTDAAVSTDGNLSLRAGTSIEAVNGVDPFRIHLFVPGKLSAEVTGDLNIEQVAGDLSIGKVYATKGSVTLSSAGSIYDGAGNDEVKVKSLDLHLNAAGAIGTASDFLEIDQILPEGQASIGEAKAQAGGDVFLRDPAGDFYVDEIRSTGGDVSLEAAASLLDAAGDDSADVIGRSISLSAKTGGIGLSLAEDLDVDTDSSASGVLTAHSALNAYLFEVDDDLLLKEVGTDDGHTAFILSPGKILNGNSGGTNVVSGATRLYAASDIGAEGNSLSTHVSNLEGYSESGGVWISNTGHLIVGGVSLTDGISAAGRVVLSASSPITIEEDIEGTSITLTAGDDDDQTADDLIVRSGVTLDASAGSVVLQAGDEPIIEEGAIVRAFTEVKLYGDYGNADPGGSTIAPRGLIDAPLVKIFGEKDSDLFDLRDVSVPADVSGGDGIDTLMGPDQVNSWEILGPNTGILNGMFTFNAVENLTGGTGDDTFYFRGEGRVDGIVDGGLDLEPPLLAIDILDFLQSDFIQEAAADFLVTELPIGDEVVPFTATGGITRIEDIRVILLAEVQEDGTLVLNMGPRAAERLMPLYLEDIDEEFLLHHIDGDPADLAGETIAVSAFGFTLEYEGVRAILGSGGLGNDTIILSGDIMAPAELDGGLGNDLLVGGAGDDVLLGGVGNDTLEGGAGDDVMDGGWGDDRYVIVPGSLDKVIDVQGVDTLDFSKALRGIKVDLNKSWGQIQKIDSAGNRLRLCGMIENAVGSEFSDWIYGSWLNNTLEGCGGDDWLFGSFGNDTLEGGDGRDRLYGEWGDDHLAGGKGNDYIEGGSGEDLLFFPGALTGVIVSLTCGGNGWSTDGLGGVDTLCWSIEGAVGTEHDDSLVGDDNRNVLYGMGDDDFIDGRGGDDVLYGGEGGDRIFAGWGNDLVVWAEGEGNDTIDMGDGWDRIRLTTGNGYDWVYLSSPPKNKVQIDGAGLTVWSLSVTKGDIFEIYTGGGDDIVAVGNLWCTDVDEVVLSLGSGNDKVDGSLTNIPIRAYGQGGDDLFIGGRGKDTFDGGEGSDWVDYSSAPRRVHVALAWGASEDGMGSKDYLKSIENVIGTQFDDMIWGTEGANIIRALGGDDHVWARGGDDVVHGGEGDDKLWGDDGNDTLMGDAGDDMLWGGRGDDQLYGGSGNDRLWGDSGDDKLFGDAGDDHLEGGDGEDRLEGGDGHDELDGGRGNDQLFGGAGNDRLEGGHGDDLLRGDSGNDVLEGGWGNDWLYGGDGDNRLYGGPGDDDLFGEDGNDLLVGDHGDDTLDGGAGVNKLVDWPDKHKDCGDHGHGPFDKAIVSPCSSWVGNFVTALGGDVWKNDPNDKIKITLPAVEREKPWLECKGGKR